MSCHVKEIFDLMQMTLASTGEINLISVDMMMINAHESNVMATERSYFFAGE